MPREASFPELSVRKFRSLCLMLFLETESLYKTVMIELIYKFGIFNANQICMCLGPHHGG